jgi:hypothetical protein
MKEIAVLTLAILATSLAVYSMTSAEPQTAIARPDIETDYFNYNTDCTKELEIECAIDVERTVVACAKAFETSGADVIADIKCAKDLLSDKKHCWPCICAEAKKKSWHVIGC